MSRDISNDLQLGIAQEEITSRMLLEVSVDANNIPINLAEQVSTMFSIEGSYLVFRFVANDNQDLIIPSTCVDINYANKTYISAEVVRGDIGTSTDGKVEKTSIKISNKYQEWAAIFASLGNVINNRPCRILEYFPDYITEAPIVIFDGVMNGARMTASQFEWEIKRSVVDFEEQSPIMTYDVSCQWQFKDARCCYVGSTTRCDKTLQSCTSLNNTLNFGGHPSVPREMVIRS